MSSETFNALGFLAAYSCEILPGLPAVGLPPLAFARPPQAAHSEGLVLRVLPAVGQPWVGNFHRGNEGTSGVFASPDPATVCIVARGQGYLVKTNTPSVFELVEADPIKQVLSVPARGLLLFVDYTTVAAYGVGGLVWRTARLSWDGVRITDAGPDSVSGLAWDAAAGKDTPFAIDTLTGVHTGGASP